MPKPLALRAGRLSMPRRRERSRVQDSGGLGSTALSSGKESGIVAIKALSGPQVSFNKQGIRGLDNSQQSPFGLPLCICSLEAP